MSRLWEVAGLFLRLGALSFGGPAAHTAMMEEEFVTRRRWVDRQHFLDLLGATNLIPGPNSTEMTMHLGYERAGRPGLFVAGACFVLPAVLISGFMAWLYVRFGGLPEVEPFLFGVKPAVLGVILGALWKLGRQALKGWRLGVIGLAVAAAAGLGAGEVASLLAGGVLGMLWLRLRPRQAPAALLALLLSAPAQAAPAAAERSSPDLTTLGLFFLKVGTVLYGSGYVLVAFLEGGLVRELGWLTQGQLLDAIAVGQFTPGPVLSTATFVGFLVLGPAGAAVATVAIFLPSFLFVLLVNPWIPRLRRSPWMAAFLDSVNVASVGLMLAVTTQLGQATLTRWEAWVVAVVATVASWVFRLHAGWVVLLGGGLGWLLTR